MFDLMLLAYQTDMTRVFTYMVAREYSELVYTQLGHQDPYHPLTHHRGDPRKKTQAGEIDVYHARLFGEFLAKMQSTRELDGTSMLDNSLLVYGSGMGNGDSHDQWDVPVALVGGAGGKLRGGRHIVCKDGTLLDTLHIAVMNKLGVSVEKFGQSTAALDLDSTA
jgi:hypothetical protein